MRRDRIIALKEFSPRSVPIPIALGALRMPQNSTTWVEDAKATVQQGLRAVLSGDISDLAAITYDVAEILRETPDARFALLIHASQALATRPTNEVRQLFEKIYVATDELIQPSDIRSISTAWNPQWVLVPTHDVNPADWISNFLLPTHQGRLILFAPVGADGSQEKSRVGPDELRLQLEEFSFEHPLIEIEPAPPEWFVPAELGPWRLAARDDQYASIAQDSRSSSEYSLSIIVPFRWTGVRTETELLSCAIKSIAENFASNDCEIIIVVDRNSECHSLTARDLGLDLADTVFVEIARQDSEPDWRAGFVRNVGAKFSKNLTGYLLFVDSDVGIMTDANVWQQIQELRAQSDFDLLRLGDSNLEAAFTTASSSFLLVRRTLFFQIGGFAEAFSHYGCEDNFFVWQVERAKAKIQSLPTSIIRHLRARHEDDDLVAKMLRLKNSADLMYRMTFDPDVHRHFFSTLGSHLWWRAGLKRFATNGFLRLLLGPAVFFLTLLESQNRRKYLAGFWEVLRWKLKRPVLWLRSNAWKAEIVANTWRKHSWKVPHFFLDRASRTRILIERRWIPLRASRFGWNFVSWRIALWLKTILDQVRWRARVARIRFAGASLWLLSAVVSLFSNIGWVLRVGTQRAWGAVLRLRGAAAREFVKIHRLRGPIERVKGETRRQVSKLHRYKGIIERIRGSFYKFIVVYIVVPTAYLATRPASLWKLHAWRLEKLAGELRAESWALHEPTAWFKLRTPRFYRWAWRPLLKARYFAEHHLIKRWRDT